ncbi:MAG: ATP-binding protein [Candidatus Acidiferrales bacterium]
MTFAEFVGNERQLAVLRRMLETGRIPHALLFAGQAGVGKYTLATLFARALNCEKGLGKICGACRNCRDLATLEDLAPLREAAIAARASARPDDVPLLLRPHPSVTVLVPDGAYIRVVQMRHVVRQAYILPASARHQVFIIDEAERLRHDYADVLLKVLEEPPANTTLILVTAAPFELRPTVRSRCIALWFSPLARVEVETCLPRLRPEWNKSDRELAAAIAAGSLGSALALNLDTYRQARAAALEVLAAAVARRPRPAELFAATRALAGKEPRAEGDAQPDAARKSFEISLDILYALLRDLLHCKAGTSDLGLQSPDLRSELDRLGREASWDWLRQAVQHLDGLEAGQRRNVNRQLALDAWALGFAGPE